MKKITILLYLVLIATTIIAQNPNLVGQLDSIIHYKYDANTEILGFESKSEFQYDQNKNPRIPDIEIKYSWDNNQLSWIADSGFVYTYDKNEKEISCEARFYDTNKPAQLAWTLATKTEYEYEENENRSLKTIYSWDENTSDWIQTQKEEYFYTVDFKDSLFQSFIWDQNQEYWLNYQKTEWSYNSIGNKVLSVVYDWDEDMSVWAIKTKSEYNSYENGNAITQLIYKQDEGTGEMNLFMRKDYKYDFSNSKVWDPYNFGHQNRLFAISTKVSNSYGEMLLSSFDTIYYSQVESTNLITAINSSGKVKIYPNPVTDYITISNCGENAIFELYDQYGKKVISFKVSMNEMVDLSILQQGIYFYKFISFDKKIQVGKLIKN